MATYIVNDLHGNYDLIQQTVDAIMNMAKGDRLIINGDGAGARGPRMNRIVKIFYEVRRGETDISELLSALSEIIGEIPDIPKEWVFESVHAGVFRKLMAEHFAKFNKCMEEELLAVIEETVKPLSEAAKDKVKIYYLPGNGEMVPNDFSTKDITVEKALPPEQRFYTKLAKDGYFEKYGIHYIGYVSHCVKSKMALISTNLLDLNPKEAVIMLQTCGLLKNKLKTVIVHYPPTISPLGSAFGFWTPNKVDVKRIDNLQKILDELQLKDAKIYFGHIHLGANDPRMDAYPSTMGFVGSGFNYTWVKPGAVIKI